MKLTSKIFTHVLAGTALLALVACGAKQTKSSAPTSGADDDVDVAQVKKPEPTTKAKTTPTPSPTKPVATPPSNKDGATPKPTGTTKPGTDEAKTKPAATTPTKPADTSKEEPDTDDEDDG